MKLHTLNKSPSDTTVSQQLSDNVDTDDSVILIEDGVYHCLASDFAQIEWAQIANNIYALKPDLDARGVVTVPDHITLVDYEAFVELTITHDSTISWY